MHLIQEEQPGLSLPEIARLEQIEANYWMKYYKRDSILPTYSSVIAGGAACAIPSLDILAMNRVIGLGSYCSIDRNTLLQVIRFYHSAGSRRFFIQLPPILTDQHTQNMLAGLGFAHHNNWTKLVRKVDPLELTNKCELSIRQIDRRESDSYGQLIFMSFNWEDTRLASWLASTVGQPGYSNYIVSWGGKDIAAGALYVENGMASMAFAGTLEPFRGKGAQSLLLRKRMQDAYDAGARWITAETAEHKDERHVRSYLNLRKSGFEVAYQRQNWIYSF